ncbi:MAG: nucleotidyltransferase domain-containing protein, partial [Desulfuromonadales bacterium]|nr:nucleotidyltransferase domain-containing protein [Desulfuromonadales bacterium]
KLSASEEFRNQLARQLNVPVQKIDFIDLSSARLAIRAVVAEEGVVLKGEESIAWHRFLQRTWRELEEHYWEKIYAT